MWGFEPSDSAIFTMEFFREKNCREILIPGIGYGRNAKIFCENGMNVTGIELSKTAIELARTQNGLDIEIYHGSVTEMPFDTKIYDGIFCHALIHLLNKQERKKFISDCFNQLKPNAFMIFTVVSKEVTMFGNGRFLSKDRYELQNGLKVFFYDSESVKQEFKEYGLLDFRVIDEPIKHMENEPPMRFFLIKCKRNNSALT